MIKWEMELIGQFKTSDNIALYLVPGEGSVMFTVRQCRTGQEDVSVVF